MIANSRSELEKRCQRCPRGFRVTERLQRGRGQFLAALPQQVSIPQCRAGLDLRLPGNLGWCIAWEDTWLLSLLPYIPVLPPDHPKGGSQRQFQCKGRGPGVIIKPQGLRVSPDVLLPQSETLDKSPRVWRLSFLSLKLFTSPGHFRNQKQGCRTVHGKFCSAPWSLMVSALSLRLSLLLCFSW